MHECPPSCRPEDEDGRGVDDDEEEEAGCCCCWLEAPDAGVAGVTAVPPCMRTSPRMTSKSGRCTGTSP